MVSQPTLKYELAGLEDLLKLCIAFDSYNIFQFKFQQAVVHVLRRPLRQPRVLKVTLKLHHVLLETQHG